MKFKKSFLFIIINFIFLSLLFSTSVISAPSDNISIEDKMEKIIPIWYKTYEEFGYAAGLSIQETSDGGFIIAGSIDGDASEDYDVDGLVFKTDSAGNIIWKKELGDYGYGYDEFRSIKQTSDECFVMVGRTKSLGKSDKSQLWVVKLDQSGNELWSRIFNIGNESHGMCIIETKINNLIIVGSTYEKSTSDVLVIKTDKNGNEIWNKTFDGYNDDYGHSIFQTKDNGFIITGDTTSKTNQDFDIWLIKIDNSGVEQWNRTYGSEDNESGNSVKETQDDGYIICGYIEFFIGKYRNSDLIILKTDSNGKKIWEQRYGYYGYSVLQTFDNTYIIASLFRNLTLIKLDESGNLIWIKNFDNTLIAGFECIQETSDNGFIIVGRSGSPNSGRVMLIKIDSSGGTIESIKNDNDSNESKVWKINDLCFIIIPIFIVIIILILIKIIYSKLKTKSKK